MSAGRSFCLSMVTSQLINQICIERNIKAALLAQYFACAFATPRRARTGRSYAYSITIQENQGAGFVRAPPIRSAANPEFIHFR